MAQRIHETTYWLIEKGVGTGPFTEAEIRQRAARGELTSDTMCIPRGFFEDPPARLEQFFCDLPVKPAASLVSKPSTIAAAEARRPEADRANPKVEIAPKPTTWCSRLSIVELQDRLLQLRTAHQNRFLQSGRGIFLGVVLSLAGVGGIVALLERGLTPSSVVGLICGAIGFQAIRRDMAEITEHERRVREICEELNSRSR